MRWIYSRWIYALIFPLTLPSAWAQQNPATQRTPPAATPAATPTATPTATPAHTPLPLPAPEDLNPAVETTPAPGPAAPAVAPALNRPGKSAPRSPHGTSPDRVALETTDITGNRELPKVLYIVPWRRSDLGDLIGKPPNSLIDEVLQPLDRDVFLREDRYYDALQPGRARPRGEAVQGSGDRPSP